ncbi:hypothetical protein [Actinomycetospora straminea]|uniref:Small secreted domain DUF320 n=1 Tax=Actinomycetospora straminea TaxID=663607 RepID=A0ABP9E571_9PSEU|nr:hypothetical protein [Actinomycetospora straminea]MDD7934624.1 hypothetical protein [Actinomycetospora straminea]
MGFLRQSVLAATLISAGLASTTGAAFAQEGDSQVGLGNVDDTQTIVPVNVCNNDVPVNALGVQVPVQDVAGTIPVLSPAEHGSEQAAGISKNCGNEVAADND